MNNFEFLQKMQQLQNGIMYDDIVDLDFASIGYSKEDKSEFWNTAITNKLLTDSQISKIEKEFVKRRRKPTIYFENNSNFENNKIKLAGFGYKKSFEDAWQFWKGGNIDEKYFNNIMKVVNGDDLKVFLETFDKCYKKDDPQNPYGELGDYLKVTEDVWRKHKRTNRLEYFVVFDKDKPVAVSTLTNFDGIGYISNVGSLTEVRGRGFGKAATVYCVKQSLANGNAETCLATEEGHYPNKFYNRIGFETKFTTIAYSKKL